MDLYKQALKAIRDMVEEARQMALPDPMVMSLATVDAAGQPSVRTVYLQAVVDSGLVFFTSCHSRKAIQLAANPRAAVCLYSQPLARQIQVEGTAWLLGDEEAAIYWAMRGRDNQLAAWASGQIESLESREQFEQRLAEYRQRFDFQREVPKPHHWCGYCLAPERIELWKKSWRYPQQRVCYQKTADGWSVTHVNP
ncbi:pyridoxine/pyridoxamine 5'-phosphate oxidase [Nitrococcus mobilis]|uniref:Pyridoxamine-phosphate oxidase n=1 Tax=Nitrococcus mobilis Nb-231 TaxID=314278 RepID=A4BVA0_9GAMM|nr:pyridoxal 5'-phosphate synthase [Nitrococcus mobilis]EAR20367.1 Pyridoxamine-phosphate oxidase [Nitrococcus mobilis Nb-231]